MELRSIAFLCIPLQSTHQTQVSGFVRCVTVGVMVVSGGVRWCQVLDGVTCPVPGNVTPSTPSTQI